MLAVDGRAERVVDISLFRCTALVPFRHQQGRDGAVGFHLPGRSLALSLALQTQSFYLLGRHLQPPAEVLGQRILVVLSLLRIAQDGLGTVVAADDDKALVAIGVKHIQWLLLRGRRPSGRPQGFAFQLCSAAFCELCGQSSGLLFVNGVGQDHGHSQ